LGDRDDVHGGTDRAPVGSCGVDRSRWPAGDDQAHEAWRGPILDDSGGGIEPRDPSREAALERELLEGLGARAVVGQQLTLVTTPTEGGESVQYFFLTRLISLDARLRTGEEHTDSSRGGYELDRIPLDRLAEYDLKPAVIRDLILDNRSALLADLPAAARP
jgi:hypothetical protein